MDEFVVLSFLDSVMKSSGPYPITYIHVKVKRVYAHLKCLYFFLLLFDYSHRYMLAIIRLVSEFFFLVVYVLPISSMPLPMTVLPVFVSFIIFFLQLSNFCNNVLEWKP